MSHLTFLFEAHFFDGSVITQTQEDFSTINPTKSCFFDVLQRDGLSHFGLFSEDNPNTYAVDLGTGQFIVNGAPFYVEGQNQLPPGTKYRLVYFRRHTHNFNLDQVEFSHDIEFIIGWQATVEGHNHQHTLVVHP